MKNANIVWGGTSDVDLVKLEKIHVDAMRCITGVTANQILIICIQTLNGIALKTEYPTTSKQRCSKLNTI